MKHRVTFKISDAAEKSEQQKEAEIGMCLAKASDEVAEEIGKWLELTKKYVKSGELITIEFDTDAGTATVLEA